MTSALTEDQKQAISASGNISRGLSDFPTDIVRLVFEASVTPGRRADNDQQRQRTAYAYCLISKEVKAWVEPMLYEKVVLESSKQVMAFSDALESKSAEFLARTVKTVWILDESFPEEAVKGFRGFFSTCLSLKSFACIGSNPCGKILRLIPKPKNGSHALRELAIIQPGHRAARSLDLTHLSIQRLQIIDSCRIFAGALSVRAVKDKMFVDALREIPRIYFDFVVPPDPHQTSVTKSKLIPLLTGGMSGSKSVSCLRSIPIASLRHDRWRNRKVDDSWVDAFDTDVRQCGGRLLVSVKSNSEVGINREASRIEWCRQWIGLVD